MPIVALVLSVVGIFCFPLVFVGIVLAIVSLVKGKEPKGAAIAALVAPLLVLPILAAIAIPNFVRFQSRSKQSECKTNLKIAYAAEKAYFAEHEAFTTDTQAVGFAPERGNRYSYAMSFASDAQNAVVDADEQRFPTVKSEAMLGSLQATLQQQRVRVGVEGGCPQCVFTAACVGNVDNDDTLDVWVISSKDRKSPDGEAVPPGVPYNLVNDVKD